MNGQERGRGQAVPADAGQDRQREIRRRQIIERRRKRRRASGVCFAAAALLFAILLPANYLLERWEQQVRVRFGQRSVSIRNEQGEEAGEASADNIYFSSEFSDPKMLREASAALCRKTAEEGIVLLRNEEKTLPLAPGASVSVFGRAAADPYIGDAEGGAYYGTSRNGGLPDSFMTVLEQAGFHVNTELWNFYSRGGGNSLTGKLEKSLAEYSDAAIVFIARDASSLAAANGEASAAAQILRLTDEERELLELAGTCSDKVIVILNTGNPMETGFLEECGIGACLWTGGLGQTGLYALGAILNGTVNPSGHLPDTFALDAMSAPAMANTQAGEITGSTVPGGDRYLVYAEGIYVGYRYYETRYEDTVTGAADGSLFQYDEIVGFPFGYGLSYTDFSWSGAQLRETAEGWNYSVRITNKGDEPGCEVVQLYLQKPYTAYDRENTIEKPAAELIGFARTELLSPGESETVTLRISPESLRTFDPGRGQYIREKGDYCITAARNAHQAANSILGAKGYTPGGTSAGSGEPRWPAEQVEAQEHLVQILTLEEENSGSVSSLSGADLRTYDSSFQYLSRSDWEGTWPVYYAGGKYAAPARLLEDLRYEPGGEGSASAPTYNTIHGNSALQLAQLRGVNPEDYRWGWLLDQFSWKETYRYVRKAGGLTNAVTQSGVPEAFGKEGSSGLTDEDGKASGMIYPSAPVLAGTFDPDLARRVGQMVGEDGLQEKTVYWYLPAFSLHRIPTGEGNSSSFSEDSLLCREMGAAIAGGASSKGMITVAGTLSLSNEEAGKHGTAVFASQQAVRELYLECLRGCVLGGSAGGVSVGTGRIGAVWCGGSRTLLEDVLRGEWGFSGVVMTDRLEKEDEKCCGLLQGLFAGTDLWRNTDGNAYTLRGAQLTYSVRSRFRKAVLRTMVVLSGSSAMNGLSGTTKLAYVRPAWQSWRFAGNAAAGAAICVLLAVSWRLRRRRRRKTNEKKYSSSVHPDIRSSGRADGGRSRRAR